MEDTQALKRPSLVKAGGVDLTHHAPFQPHRTGGLARSWLFLPYGVRIRVVAEQCVFSHPQAVPGSVRKIDLLRKISWRPFAWTKLDLKRARWGGGGEGSEAPSLKLSTGRREGLNTVKRSRGHPPHQCYIYPLLLVYSLLLYLLIFA